MQGNESGNELQQDRGWKLFLLLPRMLLHKPARGTIPKAKLVACFDKFAAGQWNDIINEGVQCAEDAATLFRRQRRRDAQTVRERRALRALQCVQSVRQTLEGAELAPGNEET